ncbi:MAG: UDP-glucose/GDP-mannose dehydrogenase family protein, partial [Syntrophomonadaceae bacterium]|nr:UDP-glucose/GDP-mannose dehydrogenase family protein [Syntrophomonadaceae bacterium]
MRIAVIGAGYVGLTTAATLAYLGHQVSCVDNDKNKINTLRSGEAPFYEPGLNELLAIVNNNLNFTMSYKEALEEARAVFLAVGTPQQANGSPDLSHYWKAVDMIWESVVNRSDHLLLVTKSTVPVGTGIKLFKRLVLRGLNSRITVASNPEFLRQGSALLDNFFPCRLVLGGNHEAQEVLNEIYAPLLEEPGVAPPGFLPIPPYHWGPEVYRVDIRTAELSKYAANAFLAMKISFINEMANIAELVGADIKKIAEIIGADPRIGRLFLNAGIGYGGSCFPKDTQALKYMADVRGYDFTLLSAVINVNNQQPYRLVSKINQALGGLEEKVICILGLTFKPETDDLREAPSIPIIHTLADAGAYVRVHDPVALDSARSLLPPGVVYCPDI